MGNIAISKTSDHIQLKIKIPNPCHEPPASSKILNQNLKDMEVLCIFKIKTESKNSEHEYQRSVSVFEHVSWTIRNPLDDSHNDYFSPFNAVFCFR